MRSISASAPSHRITFALSMLLIAALLGAGMLFVSPARAQTPAALLIGYGQRVEGAVTAPTGNEHFFTGCRDETVGLTVTTEEFAPRVELYGADASEALASGVAAAGEGSVTLTDIDLPASGPYVIVVSGRSRGDRGTYTLALTGTVDGDPLPADGALTLNLQMDDAVSGTLAADDAAQWNFRGCGGDEILVDLAAEGFVPQIELYSPIAEFPIATADVTLVEDGDSDGRARATLARTLPDNGAYNLIVSGADASDAGDYDLSLTLVAHATPGPTQPVTPQATPTPTATDTAGPRGRRGIPTPKPNTTPAATPTRQEPTATAAPTPTPEFLMPGAGEGSFEVFEISSRAGPANFVAYSPDGSVIATAGQDGAVRIYNSGRLRQTLSSHTAAVNYLAFSPNGSWLASAGDDGTVRLWDEEGNEAITLQMPDDGVTSVAFSPDSTELVATTRAGDALVWDVASEENRLTLSGHQAPVSSAAYSPDGRLIATGDGGGIVRIWNAANGTLRVALPVNVGPGSSDPILSVAFDNSGTTVIAGGVTGVNAASVQVWDIATGDPVAQFVGPREWGSIATISPDNAYIFSAGRAEPGHDGAVTASARVWDATTGELAVAFVGYTNSVIAAAFSPNGDELMTSDGNYVYVWPAPLLDVFAAAYGEPIGVQVPAPIATVTPSPTRAVTTTPTATPLPTATPTRAITPTRAPDATPTPFLPSMNLETFCTIIPDRLNLRSGPGTNFDPPITVLEAGAFLVVIGRNADSSWLQVAVLDDNLVIENTGWVSADFVFCVGDIDRAPVVEVTQ